MHILILGGGGREHALARALVDSPRVSRLTCVPGNAGTAALGENLDLSLEDPGALVRWAKEQGVGLTVVGPEGPLCAGIVDRFRASGLRIFGPTAAAARIEGDKGYAKKLMKSAHVPTAEGRVFATVEDARTYVASRETGVVVKATGLAAGKGVYVCPDPADALTALETVMVQRVHGAAGDRVLVEELLKGHELSVMALVEGQTIYVLETAQDHKAVGDGNTGPNTGGMGAYSPAPIATPDLMDCVQRDILVPIVDALRNDEAAFSGLLYAGLMITPGGPKVLEFNCRFGDPETQAIIPRLDGDWCDVLEAVVEGRLEDLELHWKSESAVCVVMASGGYPGRFDSGKVIFGLERAVVREGVQVYHAGTRRLEHLTVTAGGRVLGVTGMGSTLEEARRRAYEAVGDITFEGAFWRTDIAARGSFRGGRSIC